MTLRGTSKAGSESATNTSDVLSDTPMTRSGKGSGGDEFTGAIDSTSDIGRGSNDDPDSSGHGTFPVGFGDMFGDDDDDLAGSDADEHEFGFRATSQGYDELGVDLSPWPPLLAMLDSTEPEVSPDDRPFTPIEGVEKAHALELRAESMLQYAERGAERTGELDRTEVGLSDDNRDVVAGRDQVEVDGMLEEHTGHGLVHLADDIEMNVGGGLRMHAHLEDNIIMSGVMTDEWSGGTLITAAMSDDMAAGVGIRCTAPLDVWVHGLMGMEERPGTCAADGLLFELAGTLYEREYGPSAHVALVARHSGTVVTTMKTGFRPLMKTAIGVRNLIPGGGGGGGDASASPPAAPPAPGGGETAGAVTLIAAESGGALGRGVTGSDDTDEIVSVVRTMETASDAAEVEDLQHPASTADNLGDLVRVEVEGAGYQQVAEIYEQPVPAAAASEPDAAPVSGRGPAVADRTPPLDLTEPGTEGYDFGKSYGSLRERNHFYRLDANWRGNFVVRDLLDRIDSRAIALFEGVGGSLDDVTGDYRTRTSAIHTALEAMAEQAETADDMERLADIRRAIDEIEGLVQDGLAEVAARTGEFAGTSLGSQRVPIDRHIDTDMLRSWFQEQLQQAQDKFAWALTIDDPNAEVPIHQLAGWEAEYYGQMVQSVDKGVNPLADSSEQIAFLEKKVKDYEKGFEAAAAAHLAETGEELVVPVPPEKYELDLLRDLQKQLVMTLSDPEYIRSIEEMGADTFAPLVHTRIDEGLDFLGPDSLRPLGGGDVPPPLPAADFADSAGYVDEVRDRSFSRSALAANEETLERQATGFAEGDAAVRSRAPEPGSGAPEPSLGSRRAAPDNAQAPIIDERSGRWVAEPPAEPGGSPAPSDDASSRIIDVSWESGLQVSDDSEFDAGEVDPWEFFSAASEPEDVDLDLEGIDDVQHAPAANDDGPSGSTTARAVATGGEDANPAGTLSGSDDSSTASRRGIGTGPSPSGTPSRVALSTPGPVSTGTAPGARVADATPAGVSASDAVAGAAGTRSDLYNEPVSFEGRSLEGTPLSDDSKELAQSVDGAEIPIEDLPPVEPGPAGSRRKSILEHADDMPDPRLSCVDEDEAITDRCIEYARNTRDRSDRNADTVWRRARSRKEAVDAANARWSEFASAKRTSSTSFSDDPRQMMYLVEHETTLYSDTGENIADLYRGADPPNAIDRAHAAHYIPMPRGWNPAHETGFGRLSQGWNEFPFSHRERILNTPSKGEALSPDHVAALETGIEGYRAAGGRLSSSQHRALVDMISDLGDQHRDARWYMEGERGKRLVQLIEMLDHAAMVV